MPRPVHFEIHADNPARAKAFYETVFGWSFTKWEGGTWDYWLITTGPKEEPGIGWLAYVHVTEGNILGIMQEDPGAR